MPTPPEQDRTVVHTDGACSGNPGPGGWAWAVEGGPSASGGDLHTTNNRMELQAVIEAIAALAHPLHVVTDSTYVKSGIETWRWNWQGNGWRTKAGQEVKNRDLWERVVDAVDGGEVTFGWVKGHSGDPMNDLVDEMAVAERDRHKQAVAVGPVPSSVSADGPSSVASAATPVDARERRRQLDGRIPDGHLVVVLGANAEQLGGYDHPNPIADRARRTLADILAAKRQLHPDLVVLTGLRLGAETVAAEAAVEAGVPFVTVLPFPNPQAVWSAPMQRRFAELADRARAVVTLERKVPVDRSGAGQALNRRDGWLTRAADEAILVLGDDDRGALARVRRSLEDHFGDDLWVVATAD